VSWCLGALVPWCLGALVPWCLGALLLLLLLLLVVVVVGWWGGDGCWRCFFPPAITGRFKSSEPSCSRLYSQFIRGSDFQVESENERLAQSLA